ncbi:MAG: HpaII family restriction endonuclease [Lutibacter sp.]|nr:HpaII family restriction endonuclease [Lutibacter sp.]
MTNVSQSSSENLNLQSLQSKKVILESKIITIDEQVFKFLNSGPGNNFIFEIENDLKTTLDEFNKETYKPSGNISKITARLQKINGELGLKIKFKEVQSKQLWRNLKMIDGDLPEVLAYSLLYRWLERETSLLKISKILEEKDPLNFYNNEISSQKLYEYKLKRFLAECAMGMTSETPWHGVYDATGGVIIAKEDRDIVCFHIYDFNLFREYLINNTMFEQPSTGEDGDNPGHLRTKKGTKKYYYGWLYEENEKLYFKINLQIRFK